MRMRMRRMAWGMGAVGTTAADRRARLQRTRRVGAAAALLPKLGRSRGTRSKKKKKKVVAPSEKRAADGRGVGGLWDGTRSGGRRLQYVVAVFMYMRLLGYPASKITILTTYNGQRDLIEYELLQRGKAQPAQPAPELAALWMFAGTSSPRAARGTRRTVGPRSSPRWTSTRVAPCPRRQRRRVLTSRSLRRSVHTQVPRAAERLRAPVARAHARHRPSSRCPSSHRRHVACAVRTRPWLPRALHPRTRPQPPRCLFASAFSAYAFSACYADWACTFSVASRCWRTRSS